MVYTQLSDDVDIEFVAVITAPTKVNVYNLII